MKTITDLNKTWWYRLVKVLFCVCFLILGIVATLHVYFVNKTTRVPDVSITCDYGNQTKFNLLHDKGITINTYDDNKAIPEELNQKILQACEITQSDINTAKAYALAKTIKMQKASNCTKEQVNDPDNFLCGFGVSSDTYRIGSTLVTVNTPWKGAGFVLLYILMFFCLFEIIRHLFYYITLGKLKPQK